MKKRYKLADDEELTPAFLRFVRTVMAMMGNHLPDDDPMNELLRLNDEGFKKEVSDMFRSNDEPSHG